MQAGRIYVRAPNWVGDLVMATPSFARLRRAFPAVHITCGLRPYLRSLLDGTDFFDEIVDTPPVRGPGELRRQAAGVRRGRYDLAVVLPNSLETGLVPLLAGVPRRLGYRQGRPGTMNLGLRVRAARPWWRRRGVRRLPEPMPRYYAKLLDVLGLPAGGERGELVVTAAERAEWEDWLREHGVGPQERIVAFNAGASFGASKLWNPERFAAVARHFQERHGLRALFLGGPAEAAMVASIAADAGALAAVDPPTRVGMLKPMLERASLLVTTDSGPRHVAVALGVPLVCVIGPTDRRYTDYGLERQILIDKQLDCAPCHRKVCPLGHHRCMQEISVAEVVAAGERLLPAR